MIKYWSVVEFICDNCGELWIEQSLGNSDYATCLETARKDGWEILDDGKVFCKACKCKETPLISTPGSPSRALLQNQKVFNLLQTAGTKQRMLIQVQQE